MEVWPPAFQNDEPIKSPANTFNANFDMMLSRDDQQRSFCVFAQDRLTNWGYARSVSPFS